MNFEQVVEFWEQVPSDQKTLFFKNDTVLQFFDMFTILEVLESKLVKFDVDKLAEIQNKIDVLPTSPTGEDQGLRDIFAPSATKNANVRNHKLVRVIQDRLIYVVENKRFEPVAAVPEAAPPPEAPLNSARSDSGRTAKTLWEKPRPVCLSPHLPQDASLPVRTQPREDAKIITNLSGYDHAIAYANIGDWWCIDAGENDYWILSRANGEELLVDLGTQSYVESPPETQQHRDDLFEVHSARSAGMDDTRYSTSNDIPTLRMNVSGDRARAGGSRRNSMSPIPSADVHDPTRFVTYAEYNRLQCKVTQLEADMRALRLLLRSWSLDTPGVSNNM